MNNPAKIEKAREVTQPAPVYVAPNVDIAETKDDYVLEADMPGVGKDGLEVLLEDNELTIVGKRAAVPAEGHFLHRESAQADFRRTFVLDPTIDATKITAQIDQGVLVVRLPKAEKVKPRKIKVTD